MLTNSNDTTSRKRKSPSRLRRDAQRLLTFQKKDDHRHIKKIEPESKAEVRISDTQANSSDTAKSQEIPISQNIDGQLVSTNALSKVTSLTKKDTNATEKSMDQPVVSPLS